MIGKSVTEKTRNPNLRMRGQGVRVFFLLLMFAHAQTAKKQGKKSSARSKAQPKLPPPSAPSISAYRPAVSAEEEEALMASILGGMDSMPVDPLPKKPSRKRKPSPSYESSRDPSPIWGEHRKPRTDDLSSDGPLEDYNGPSSDDNTTPYKRPRVDDTAIPALGRLASIGVDSDFDHSFDDINMDDFMDVDDLDLDVKPPVKKEPDEIVIPPGKNTLATDPSSNEDSKPTWLSLYDSLAVEAEESLGPLSGNSNAAKSSSASILESDGSLRFFWLDYLELEGKLYFIGKVKDKSTGAWISCCVTVENIERNLFVLPREKRMDLQDDILVETDIIPSDGDIHEDFDEIRKTIGIKSWRGKFVKRNYVFGEQDIPRGESRWMKVVYGFTGMCMQKILDLIHDGFVMSEKVIPITACSQNIARIMGTNTSAFELLVLKRKIMGPCWIQIKKPEVDNKGVRAVVFLYRGNKLIVLLDFLV